MKGQLEKILEELMTGSPAKFKQLKKQIETFWHGDTKSFDKAAVVALDYLPKFNQIKTVENQAAFISGLNIFFLVLADEHFDALKDFTLKIIQHPDGRVREAIRNTASWLHCSLTMRVSPFVWPQGKDLTKDQIQEQENARKQYKDYVAEIEHLIDTYNIDQNVESISEMKPSVEKSLQMLWAELTESPSYREIAQLDHPVSVEIAKRRKEIESEFTEKLRQLDCIYDFEDILDIIYQEDGQDDLGKIIRIFDNGDINELENILDLATDAWNYFPHRVLGDISPEEMVQEIPKGLFSRGDDNKPNKSVFPLKLGIF